MRTEIKKKSRSGFTLNEQELRRLSSTVREQLKTAYPDSETRQYFSVKFKNGSIAEPSTIDEIFAQENRGSEAIIYLALKEASQVDDGCRIEIEFSVPDEEDRDWTINYEISHDDKDWVFVTNSKIEERLSRIKKFSIVKFTKSRNFLSLVFPVIFLLGTTLIVPIMSPDRNQEIEAIKKLEQHFLQTNGPIVQFQAELQMLLLQFDARSNDNKFPLYMLVAVIALVGTIYVLAKAIEYLFPAYNFVWGDYIDLFQRKKSLAYGIFVLVILAVVISVVANLISGRLEHVF